MFRLIFSVIVFFNILFGNITNNKKVSLQLSWFDQFQFAGYYMAKEKGFYDDVGIAVDIKPFKFGIDIPYEVNRGKVDFAIGRETLILEKTSNRKIVTLYALFQYSPLVLLSTKESGINNIQDFNNKKIMTTIDDASEVSIKAMIVSEKFDTKNLNFIEHTHNIEDLLLGNTDVISAYSSKAPFYLDKMGVEYNLFSPKDYGFDMYSDFLYTSESKIANDLQVVLNFKEASLKGWEYAYNHIEEAVEIILEKYNTQNLSKEELLFEAKELKKLSYYETDRLGDISLSKLQRIYDLYNIMGLVQNKIDIEDFVLLDNSFIYYLKDVWNKLSKYKELPYIYFFITLFFILIFLLLYKNIMLYKATKKILANKQQLEKMNKELKELSEKDYLTKLYNRRYFELLMKEFLALSKRENQPVSILIIDIDNFKKINDTYGHQIGDHVLCSLADIMNYKKRKSDIIARFGGEEFTILLPNTSIEGAKVYSEHLRKMIEAKTLKIDGIAFNITVSMGLTSFKVHDDIYSALNRADEGLYISKRKGKNQLYIK